MTTLDLPSAHPRRPPSALPCRGGEDGKRRTEPPLTPLGPAPSHQPFATPPSFAPSHPTTTTAAEANDRPSTKTPSHPPFQSGLRGR